jgi:hypothetical protein
MCRLNMLLLRLRHLTSSKKNESSFKPLYPNMRYTLGLIKLHL